ncbi:hypothetical protein HII12_003193 [Brettanomyces bruxellensis]|nr:hypothetical protein HII12_003193 [Brettanomyces bruxellensis]
MQRETQELQLCYDKNLIMLQRLKSELQKENEALKAETKYASDYAAKTGLSSRMMQKSLKEAQVLLEDDKENSENNIEPKELSRIGGDKQSFITDSLDFKHNRYYNPEEDDELIDLLSTFSSKLADRSKISQSANEFEEVLNQVHNLLGLLDKNVDSSMN